MSTRPTLDFLRTNPSLLAFGFVMALGSSFGQTFFIGIFGPGIRDEFGLSHTAWGTIYMLGTLGSAALLPFTGKLVDSVALRRYAMAVCALMVFACTVTANVGAAAWLVLAVFLLRHAGQGLMSHVALTSMARYFDVDRGRAIAVAALGFSVGEAILPVLAVFVIAVLGWRATYGAAALIVLLVLLPTAWRLLRGHEERHRRYEERARTLAAGRPDMRAWSRRDLFRSLAFYLLAPGMLTPSLVTTALFFHHIVLAAEKGWSPAWITGNYVLYAAATLITSLLTGVAVDRYTAVRVVPFMLAPLLAGLLVFASSSHPLIVWPYFILIGANVGISHIARTALWAELYGTAHLGAIKSLIAALGVLSSAFGPVAMGLLMDRGFSGASICVMFALICVLGTGGMIAGLTRHRRIESAAARSR
jgi:MFS family permease